MAFNEQLASRIREALSDQADLQEKYMFGGVCFMVNGKMCVGVVGDELMCRMSPEVAEGLLDENNVRPMDFTGRPMKGYLFVSSEGYRRSSDLQKWIDYCLAFNPRAKSSRKR